MAKPLLHTDSARYVEARDLIPPDTQADSAFSALARLAAHGCDASMAFIGVLGPRHLRLKARIGIDTTQLPRPASLIDETAAAPEGLLLVEDLAHAPAFAQHAVRSVLPTWHFYAGVPITNQAGQMLGTAAVVDLAARSLSAEQAQVLRDVAVLAAQAIEAEGMRMALAQQAITDPLTGLSNRVHFEQALEAEFAHAMRRGEPFAVLTMDLDGFQAVGDGFGHAAGEEVLQEVSRRLRQEVRTGDLIAHCGLDAFSVLMRHGNDKDARALKRRIVKSVTRPILLCSKDEIGVGISVGIAAYTDAVDDVRSLLQQAEQALFEDKRLNEKRWRLFLGLR